MKKLLRIFTGPEDEAHRRDTERVGFVWNPCAVLVAVAQRDALRKAARNFSLLTSAVALLAAAGCDDDDSKTANGDKDPKVKYLVTVEPSSAPARLKPGVDDDLVNSVDLRVGCDSFNPPSNCSDPATWKYSIMAPSTLFQITIPQSTEPHAVAKISFIASKFTPEINSLEPNGEKVLTIAFFRSPVPRDLILAPPGGGVFKLKVFGSSAVPERKEQATSEPDIEVYPSVRWFSLSGGDIMVTESLHVRYKGPATTFSEMKISGASASKFTVVSPALHSPVGDGIDVAIFFETGLNDYMVHNAVIKISTAHPPGKTTFVDLYGQRKP